MARYIVQRALLLVPILLAVSVVVFVMMRILPGDAAMAFAVENPAQLEALRRDLGLDQPIYVQYGIWFWNMLHGDMGRSIQLRKPVLDVLLPQFVNTLILAAGSFVLAIVVGWSVGIVSATRQYSLADRLTMLVTLFGVSMPAFWLGLVLMWLFAYKLRWLPAAGMYSIRGEKTFAELLGDDPPGLHSHHPRQRPARACCHFQARPQKRLSAHSQHYRPAARLSPGRGHFYRGDFFLAGAGLAALQFHCGA
jgi:peptide/nickel transport system permease protein